MALAQAGLAAAICPKGIFLGLHILYFSNQKKGRGIVYQWCHLCTMFMRLSGKWCDEWKKKSAHSWRPNHSTYIRAEPDRQCHIQAFAGGKYSSHWKARQQHCYFPRWNTFSRPRWIWIFFSADFLDFAATEDLCQSVYIVERENVHVCAVLFDIARISKFANSNYAGAPVYNVCVRHNFRFATEGKTNKALIDT